MGTLLDGTGCKILLDGGGTKSGMSKQYHLQNKSLHDLPNFRSKVKVIQVGNTASVNTLFIIPIIIKTRGHMFEIYIMVSEIYDSIDFVLDVKNVVELEAEISMRDLKFKSLNRAVPVFPLHKGIVKPKEKRYVRIEAPFLNEISRIGILKLFGVNTYDTLIMNVKLERKKAFFEITND